MSCQGTINEHHFSMELIGVCRACRASLALSMHSKCVLSCPVSVFRFLFASRMQYPSVSNKHAKRQRLSSSGNKILLMFIRVVPSKIVFRRVFVKRTCFVLRDFQLRVYWFTTRAKRDTRNTHCTCVYIQRSDTDSKYNWNTRVHS